MSLQNVATDTAKLQYQALADKIDVLTGTGVSDSNAASYASSLDVLYQELQDAKRNQLSLLTPTASTSLDGLLAKLTTVSASYQAYKTDPSASNLTNLTNTVKGITEADVATFKKSITDLGHLWSLQDQIFYEYSKTGESALNDQLGQLGDALDTLSRVIDTTNQIDMSLSVNPQTSDGRSLVRADGNLNANYAAEGFGSLNNIAGSSYNAAQYAYQAYNQLVALSKGFDPISSTGKSIQATLDGLVAAGVNGWGSVANPTAGTSSSDPIWGQTIPNDGKPDVSFVSGAFAKYWQNQTLRRSVSDLLTTLSSENDIQKQNLRQAMFIYQEFIKSASEVMDRVYDAIKSASSRIAR
jgi:hypothetical protein